MNINVTTKNVTIDSENLNKGEYNIRECNFTFSEEYDGLVCKALFTVSKTKLTYEQSIVNNKCEIPYEATINRGKVILGVIGYEIEDEELVKRYSPKPDEFFVLDGSYVEDIENQSTPTPSELEQLDARVSQVEIDAAQVEINTRDIATISVDYGKTIELSLDSSTFILTATLKNKNGAELSSSNIDLPIESMIINASYDNTTKELVLTLQNGNTVRVSVADLISGLQSEITSSNKLNADLVDDSTSTNKFVTASDKTNWNAKVSDTDYATGSKGGVVKVDGSYGTNITNTGYLYSTTKSFAEYNSADGSLFISKRTLENVITGKNLETANNKVTSLSSSSTDTQYPSAKCVYDLVGNIETILETLDVRRWH